MVVGMKLWHQGSASMTLEMVKKKQLGPYEAWEKNCDMTKTESLASFCHVFPNLGMLTKSSSPHTWLQESLVQVL